MAAEAAAEAGPEAGPEAGSGAAAEGAAVAAHAARRSPPRLAAGTVVRAAAATAPPHAAVRFPSLQQRGSTPPTWPGVDANRLNGSSPCDSSSQMPLGDGALVPLGGSGCSSFDDASINSLITPPPRVPAPARPGSGGGYRGGGEAADSAALGAIPGVVEVRGLRFNDVAPPRGVEAMRNRNFGGLCGPRLV